MSLETQEGRIAYDQSTHNTLIASNQFIKTTYEGLDVYEINRNVSTNKMNTQAYYFTAESYARKYSDNSSEYRTNLKSFTDNIHETSKKGICLHHTGGWLKGDLQMLTGVNGQVSVPFVIGRTGYIYKLLDPDTELAWHLGSNINKSSFNHNNVIGIEISNLGHGYNSSFTDGIVNVDYRRYSRYEAYTDLQYEALKKLLKVLAKKYPTIELKLLPEKERYSYFGSEDMSLRGRSRPFYNSIDGYHKDGGGIGTFKGESAKDFLNNWNGISAHVNWVGLRQSCNSNGVVTGSTYYNKTDIGPALEWNRILSDSVTLPVASNKSLNSPLHWYHISEACNGGYFPVGQNRCIHGGAHLPTVGESAGIKAMAPGHVVACRFLSKNKEEEYIKIQKDNFTKEARRRTKTYFVDPSYSSFVLLKHHISEIVEEGEPRTGSFYSLYMNLSPMENWADVPWFKKLKELITGGCVSTEYSKLGEFSFNAVANDNSYHRYTRPDDNNLRKLNITDEQIILADGEEGKVITFTKDLFPVASGDYIGFSKKMAGDANNFVHWEVFESEGKDNVFDLLKSLYGNSFNYSDLSSSENYFTRSAISEIFPGATINEALGSLLVKNENSSDMINRPTMSFLNSNIPFQANNNKQHTYKEWLTQSFYVNNTYDIKLSFEVPSNYRINENSNVKLKTKIYSYNSESTPQFLRGKKEGSTNKFIMPTEDSSIVGDTEYLMFSLRDLKSGITVNVPNHANELLLELDGEVLQKIKIDTKESEQELFEEKHAENLRNIKTSHLPEWTNKSAENLVNTLLNENVIPAGYSFNRDHFSEITWLDSNKEFKLHDPLFSNEHIPENNNFINIHPVTCSWLLKLLLNNNKILFKDNMKKDDGVDNPIDKYAFVKSSKNQVLNLGDKIKFIILSKYATKSSEKMDMQLPKDGATHNIVFNENGVFSKILPLDYWGKYALPSDSSATLLTENIDEGIALSSVEIEKPEISNIAIEDGIVGKITATLKATSKVPSFMPGILYLQYRKESNETSNSNEPWTEFDKGLCIGFTKSSTNSLVSKFQPKELYSSILGNIEPLKSDEKVAMKFKVVTPNGLLNTIGVNKESSLLGSKIHETKRSDYEVDCVNYPANADSFSDFESSLVLPTLKASGEDMNYIENDKNLLLCSLNAEFTNNSYIWVSIEDFYITSKVLDSDKNEVPDSHRILSTVIKSIDNKKCVAAEIEPLKGFYSEDSSSSNTIEVTFTYPKDSENPIIENKVEVSYKSPEITDITVKSNETGDLLIEGVKKNMPDWVEFKSRVDWSNGKDKSSNSVSWHTFLDQRNGAGSGDKITFKVDKNSIVSDSVSVSFIPTNISQSEAFPMEIKSETKYPAVSSTNFKSAEAKSNFNFRENADKNSGLIKCVLQGTKLRLILNDDGEPIKRGGYYFAEANIEIDGQEVTRRGYAYVPAVKV